MIDQSGIYPDAGEKDDGIVVNRSIGMIVKSMVQFAAGDDVDNTLHDLIMNLKVSNSYNGDQTQWKGTDQTTYLKFQPDDSQTILEYAALEGYPAMFDIDEGWSGLEIKQRIGLHWHTNMKYSKRCQRQVVPKMEFSIIVQ